MYTVEGYKPEPYNSRLAVDGENVYPMFNEEHGIYNGMPNDKDLKAIAKYIGKEAIAEQWTVYSILAIDNLPDLEWRRHSPHLLKQYADKISGGDFILNHDWDDANESVAFMIEAKMYRCSEVPRFVLDKNIMPSSSKKIAKAEGYNWVLCKVAVEAGSMIDQGMEKRRVQDVSIGAKLYDEEGYCPDCTEKYGRYVRFGEEELDSNGGMVQLCPHTPLTPLHLWMSGWLDEDEQEEIEWSKGVIVDGAIAPVELSLCVQGAIPAAGIIRA